MESYVNNNKRMTERSDTKPVTFHFPQIPTLLTGLISAELPTTGILMGPYQAALLKNRVDLTGKAGAQEGTPFIHSQSGHGQAAGLRWVSVSSSVK